MVSQFLRRTWKFIDLYQFKHSEKKSVKTNLNGMNKMMKWWMGWGNTICPDHFLPRTLNLPQNHKGIVKLTWKHLHSIALVLVHKMTFGIREGWKEGIVLYIYCILYVYCIELYIVYCMYIVCIVYCILCGNCIYRNTKENYVNPFL